MRKITRLVSAILTASMVFGVLTVAPFHVSAAQSDDESVYGPSKSYNLMEGTGFDISDIFEREEQEKIADTQPANSPVEYNEDVNNESDYSVSENIEPNQNYLQTTASKADAEAVGAEPEFTSGDFTYILIDGEAYITYYTGGEEDVVFPAEIDGYTVVGLSKEGRTRSIISNIDGVKSITIPDSVTSIGDYAFVFCTNLTSVAIPDGLTSIGDYAFHSCLSLTSITIPDGVTSIGDYAFYSCVSLTSVAIPDGVTSIGYLAFYYCIGLTSITIPDSVTSIGNYAFSYCTSLTSIKLPNSLISIGDGAFSSCISLTSIKLPDSVTSVGRKAFCSCDALESAVFPNTLSYMGESVFCTCDALKSFVMPYAITSVPRETFRDCYSLENVVLHNNITYLDHKAFAFCYNLKSIDLPDSLIEMADSVFQDAGLEEIKIPGSLKRIGDGAFRFCKEMKKAVIEEGVESIGSIAFGENYSLKDVVLPSTLTKIEDSAFYSCTSLTSITIPDSLTSIGNRAFEYCSSLKTLVIPGSPSISKEGTFAYCTSLTDLYLPDNVSDFILPYTYSTATFKGTDNVAVHCSKYSLTARSALNANLKTVFDSNERSEEASALDVEQSSFTASIGNLTIPFVCNYSIKDEALANISNLKIRVRIPNDTEFLVDTIYVDGVKTTDYSFDSSYRYLDIPVTNQSARVSLSIRHTDTGYNLRTYAALYYYSNTDHQYHTETIDAMDESLAPMTIVSDSVTSTETFKVTGNAPAEKDVNLYIGSDLCATVKSNKVGSYSAEITIPNPVNTRTYSVSAVSTDSSGKEVSAQIYTQYVRDAPKLKRFIMEHGGAKYDLLTGIKYNPLWEPWFFSDSPSAGISGGHSSVVGASVSPERFIIEIENADMIESLTLTSTKDGKSASLTPYWDEDMQAFVTKDILFDYDGTLFSPKLGYWTTARYLPKLLSLNYTMKPVDTVVDMDWAMSVQETNLDNIKGLNSYTVIKNTENTAELKLNFDTGSGKNSDVNVRYDKYSPEQFIEQYPQTASEIKNNIIKDGLSDFTSEAIPGTEAVHSSEIDNVTSRELVNSIERSWAPIQTDNATRYSNFTFEEDGGISNFIYDKGLNVISREVITGPNALSLALSLLGKNSAFFNAVASASSVPCALLTSGADFYQQLNRINGDRNFYNDLRQITAGADYLTEDKRAIANNIIDKMAIMSAFAFLSNVAGLALIAVGGLLIFSSVPIAIGITLFGTGLLLKVLGEYLHYKAGLELKNLFNVLFNGSPFNWIIDPSGYVYAGLESNRISGATVTAYGILYDEETDDETFWESPDESRQEIWDAAEYSQLNPITTDALGNYAWNVPEGWWKVVVEAEGYETYTTEWLPVPPPQYDVNIGLTTLNAPALQSFEVTETGLVLTFIDCMKPESLSEITVKDNAGEDVPFTLEFEAETSPQGDELAKVFTLSFDTDYVPTSDIYVIEITNAENYSGIKGDIEYRYDQTRLIGDVNGDGVISIADVTELQKYLANIIDFDDEQLAVADTNGDGIISIDDATQIQRYLAELIPSLG